MAYALDVHFAFAFFVVLCAVFVGWVQMGRRVMAAVLGIQVLAGLAVAAVAGAQHATLPPKLWMHVLGGLLAMGAYIMARRVTDRGSAIAGYALSFVGLLLIAFTYYYGGVLVSRGG